MSPSDNGDEFDDGLFPSVEAGLGEDNQYDQTIEAFRQKFGPEQVPSGILHTRLQTYFSITQLDGLNSQRNILSQLAFETQLADLQASYLTGIDPAMRMPDPIDMGQRARALNIEGLVPVSIVNLVYHRPSHRAMQRFVVAASRQSEIDIPSVEEAATMLEERQCFMMSSLLPVAEEAFSIPEPVHDGPNVRFLIDEQLYITNIEAMPTAIEMDFGDGTGFRAVDLGEVVEVSYDTNDFPDGVAIRRIKAQVHYENQVLRQESYFRHTNLAAPAPDDTWSITAGIEYQGAKASGTAMIYYGLTNGVKHTSLQRPFVISEGFPGGYSYSYLYNKINQHNLLTDLLSRGYDAIFLVYNSGTDYIQRNAFVVVALIEHINAQNPPQPLVVSGASMGGLIVRYALAYMEKNNLDHNAGKFFSLDSPQQGANVPVSVQFFLRVLDLTGNLSAAQKRQLAQLSSTAARQMLSYWVKTAEPSEDYPLRDPLNTTLFNELQNIGNYPAQTRNISAACGSNNGVATMEPLTRQINWHGNMCANGDVYSLPNRDSSLKKVAEVSIKWTSRWINVQNTYNLDGAPGGWSDVIKDLAKGLFASGYGWVANKDGTNCDDNKCGDLFPRNCFIPSISALDIQGSHDPFQTIPASGASTPFNSYYISTANLGHVDISTAMAAFLLNEFRGDLPPLKEEVTS